MSALSRFCWVATISLFAVATANASITYKYAGRPFTTCFGTYASCAKDSVTGSFTLNSPLAANLSNYAFVPTSYSFTDRAGVFMLGSGMSLATATFEVSTDSNRDIVAWAIVLSTLNSTSGGCLSDGEVIGTYSNPPSPNGNGQAGDYSCYLLNQNSPSQTFGSGENSGFPGVWAEQSVLMGTASPVNLSHVGIPTYTSSEGTLTADFPDGHLPVLWDGMLNTYQIFWAENQSWGSYGRTLRSATNAYQALGIPPVFGAWGSGPTASGDRSNPSSFDNSGSWLMSAFRVRKGTFNLDPNSNYLIGFYHGEDHWFTDAGTTNSYYHDPVSWNGIGSVTSSNGGISWTKHGMVLGVPDLKPAYPAPFAYPNPNAPWGGIGNQCTVLDNHSDPAQPAWVTFFAMITPGGITAGHGITAARTTDPNAARANWYAYYNGSFGTQQQSNEGLDSPLPGLDGNGGTDYDHYALGNPSVNWNTELNVWVLVAATNDATKILISYSNTPNIADGWLEPMLLYSTPSGTVVHYPTIVGPDHRDHLNDTESGSEATIYWAQFDSAGVRSMMSAPLHYSFCEQRHPRGRCQ